MRSLSAPVTLPALAGLFHALSDETRLCLVALLRDGERCVCELTDALETGQSRLSFHLRILREAGVVQDRRDGRWVHYSLVPGALEGLEEGILALSSASVVRAARTRCC